MSVLAINGGQRAIPEGEFKDLPWPPVSEETAESLKQLYLSRAWSFNSKAEQDFENEFAAYNGAKYGIFMMNGTVTLQAALIAMGVKPGDEVIVPALTWIATIMAVCYVGATPVFVDIDKDTFAIDCQKAEEAITPKTKAIIPVHLYGSMADLAKLTAIASKYNLQILEDCAHMQGGKWMGKGAGAWGDIGSYSFQQSKTLAAGESGICITSNPDLAEKLYRVKHIGYSRYDKQGQAGTPPPQGLQCHNFRGLAMTAKILSDQLKGLDELLERYDQFAKIVEEGIVDIPGVRVQARGRLASRQGYYAFCYVFDGPEWDNIPTGKIQAALAAEGAPTGRTYGPVYSHMLFNLTADQYVIPKGGCPVAEHVHDRTFNMLHWKMYEKNNAELLLKAIRKISDNKKELTV